MGQNVEKGVAGHFHRLHNSRWEVQTCWIILNMHRAKVHGTFIWNVISLEVLLVNELKFEMKSKLI